MHPIPDSVQTSINRLWLNCRLWMSEDCRDMQVEYQTLDSRTNQPVGDVQAHKLNRIFIKWEEEDGNTLFVNGQPFTPANNSPEPYDAEAYVAISPQMLLLAISQWIFEIVPSDIQAVDIKQMRCNTAAWVRLHPSQLTGKPSSLYKKDGPEISLTVYSVSCDIEIENFLDFE